MDQLKKTKLVQNTPEWLANRRTTIGGSEVAAIMGKNKYCSRNSLLNRKKNNNSFFYVSPAMKWGTFFEDIAVDYLSKNVFHADIYDTSAHYACGNYNFSPDGICNIKGKKYLIEIKCPTSRNIHSSTIPEHYYWQIKYGSYLLGIQDVLFCDFKFALCPINLLDTRLQMDENGDISYGLQHPYAKGKIGIEGINANKDLTLDWEKYYDQPKTSTTDANIGWKLLDYKITSFSFKDYSDLIEKLPTLQEFIDEINQPPSFF